MKDPGSAGALLKLMAEAYRLQLLRGLETMLAHGGYRLVAGVDEAGRGCLAGPVVAAAVLVDPECLVPGVDDSKKLAADDRARLASAIRDTAIASAVAVRSAEVIDSVNVLEATKQAMLEALRSLRPQPECVLVDAVPLEGAPCPTLPVIRGDAFSFAIACASILAKTERDRLMSGFDQEYPGYGLSRNKGYGAPEHLQALDELGPTPIHRLTFRSVIPRSGDVEGALA